MEAAKEQIKLFIPQREPFIMIDNLLEATQERFETDFRILPDNIFVEDGILREFALIENISQSCAAGLVIINKSDMGVPVNGFIGGISKLRVYDLPRVDDVLQTIITPVAQLGDLFLLKAVNYVRGMKLLECEVKLAGSSKNSKYK